MSSVVRPVRPAVLVAAAVAFAVWATALIAPSPPRVLGDGLEYLVMAEKLASGRQPSLTLREARDYGIEGVTVGAFDRWRETLHFWFYPALVVPFAWLASWVGGSPVLGFTLLNVSLLAVLLAASLGHLRWPAVLFVVASPVWWWVDKPHTETFTYVLLALSLLWLTARPHLSLVALAAASTQNPPLALLLPFVVFHAWRCGAVDARAWRIAAPLAVGFVLLAPSYYLWRIGRWSPLTPDEGVRWPTLDLWGYVVWDPNVGLLFWHPWSVSILGLGLASIATGAGRRTVGRDVRGELVFSAAAAALFLFSFAQTSNLNHGATVGMSRYALWLVPLTIPAWRTIARATRPIRAVAGCVAIVSATWTLATFRPALDEGHLRPSAAALFLWAHVPSAGNPLPEIFFERIAGTEGPWVPVAAPGCSKALIIAGEWPTSCATRTVPEWCATPRALCYFNATTGGPTFVATAPRGAGHPWSLPW